MKNYKVTIKNTGGEYAVGLVLDEDKKQLLLDSVDDESIGFEVGNDDLAVGVYDCDKQIVACYGPCYGDATVFVETYLDEEFENIDDMDYIEEMPISESSLKVFTIECPYVEEFVEKNNDDLEDEEYLIYGGYRTEKRIHFPIHVSISDEDIFDLNNVFVGVFDFSEILVGEDIVSSAYYIPKEKQERILELFLKEEKEGNEDLQDYLSEIRITCFNENNGEDLQDEMLEIKKVLIECECNIGNIEGKGETEDIYIFLKNSDEEAIFEDNV
jgi:hypothetical protein